MPSLETVNRKAFHRLIRAILLALVLLSCRLASAAPPAVLAQWKLHAPARALEIHPETGIAVASLALKGIAVVDVRSAGGTPPATVPGLQPLSALALPGGGFLLCDRFGHLVVIEPSNPAQPTAMKEVRRWPVDGIPTHALRRGELLLVASGAAGVQAFDWASPKLDPQLRSRYPFVDYSKKLQAGPDGSYFLADNLDTGMQVLHYRDVERPVQLAVRHSGFVDSIAVHGALAAVADRAFGVRYYSITDPTNPTECGTVPLRTPSRSGKPPRVVDVAFTAGGQLMICEGPDGFRTHTLRLRDVQQPAAPADWEADWAANTVAYQARQGTLVALQDGRLLRIDVK